MLRTIYNINLKCCLGLKPRHQNNLSKMKCMIVDMPQSNHVSVKYWLMRNGLKVANFSEGANISYDALVLPGVGSFDGGASYLLNSGADNEVRAAHNNKKLIIGICLGMQLFFSASEEGDKPGLGFLPITVRHLGNGPSKVPNIGWRTIKSRLKYGSLFNSSKYKYFFMHGYAVSTEEIGSYDNKMQILSSSCNGEILAGFKLDNLVGFQFHPEKSFRGGDDLLKNVISEYNRDNCETFNS